MRKLLKTLFTAFSIVLLTGCSISQKDADWTKDAYYFYPSNAVQIYTSKQSPLLECKNENEISKEFFDSFDFQGSCVLGSIGGPGVAIKFNELWETETKEAIYDILCNRYQENFFERAKDNPDDIFNYEFMDNFLNSLFPQILMINGEQGQYFAKAIGKREDGSFIMNLCEYTINFYDSGKNLVFKYEHDYYWKENI